MWTGATGTYVVISVAEHVDWCYRYTYVVIPVAEHVDWCYRYLRMYVVIPVAEHMDWCYRVVTVIPSCLLQ